jgi:hypothetical protein
MHALIVAIVLATTVAHAGPRLELGDLKTPRCWVSQRERAIACPAYEDTRGLGDGGWVIVNIWFADPERMFETLVVRVGADYAGTIAFEGPVGLSAVRRRLATGGFVAAPSVREVRRDVWLATRPRSRLVWRDQIQLDAVLEVDCGGRLVQDAMTVTGQRWFAAQLGTWIVVFGRTEATGGSASSALIDVWHRVIDPTALCAGE